MATFRSYLVLIVSVIPLIFLSACSSQQIHGKVLDLFGKGIEGVSVTIGGSPFSARTDSSGECSIDYAPGVLHLRFSKLRYTTQALDLTLAQKADFPAEMIMLYPIPKNSGFYYLGSDHVVQLGATAVLHQGRTVAMSAVDWYRAGPVSGPTIKAGRAVFIDTDPADQRLAKLAANRLIYQVT